MLKEHRVSRTIKGGSNIDPAQFITLQKQHLQEFHWSICPSVCQYTIV